MPQWALTSSRAHIGVWKRCGIYSGQVPTRFNTLAVVAFVLTLALCFPVAVFVGHIAKRQIRRTGERGERPVAISLALGYFWLILAVGFFGTLFSIPVLEWLGFSIDGSHGES